jgi:hypothetical protein
LVRNTCQLANTTKKRKRQNGRNNNIGQQFNLVTTIYQADLAEDRGWVTLELDGEDKDIEEGIAWAMSKGIRVDTISDR